MKNLTINELREIILDMGLTCDRDMVECWLKDGSIKNVKEDNVYKIIEQDIEDFVYNALWNGSPYERGLDNETKIDRLLEEIASLKAKVSKLQDEKHELELELGKIPF